MPKSAPVWYRLAGGMAAVAALASGLLWARLKRPPPVEHPPLPTAPAVPQDTLSPLAAWPWPHAQREALSESGTHWQDHFSSDRTCLDLFDFDFGRNSGLRLVGLGSEELCATFEWNTLSASFTVGAVIPIRYNRRT